MKFQPISKHMSFHCAWLSIRKIMPRVLPKRIIRPVFVYCFCSVLSCSILSYLFSFKAYVCTAPTAFPCAVAEGLSFFDVPIWKVPFITNHSPFNLHRERVYGEGEKEKGMTNNESGFYLIVLSIHHSL